MARRDPLELLTVAAAALLAGQLALLAALQARPEPPADLPTDPTPRRNRAPTHATAPPEGDRVALEVLDRLLADRLAAACQRAAVDPTGRGPTAAARAAALADPTPDGPAVRALIDAYDGALGELGETLDATSIPATAASP
jgi:hypothetical protein